jgi:PAS domain-containing protein
LNKVLPVRDDSGNELLHNVIVRPLSSGPSQRRLLRFTEVAATRERVLRERQNAPYHATVDTAPDAIIVGLDLSIHWLNATARHLLGYAPGELIGRTIGVILENKKPANS